MSLSGNILGAGMLEVGLTSPGFLKHKNQEAMLFAGKPVEKKEPCCFEVFIWGIGTYILGYPGH